MSADIGIKNHPQSDIKVKHIGADDYDGWLPLWNENNQNRVARDVTAETWNRLCSPIFPVHGLCLYEGHEMAGLLHYILHPVTGHIHPVCYMQDVFIAPEFRRKGYAKNLIGTLATLGQSEEWARIYWLAEQDNKEAQALYKNLGVKLDFTLHVLPL